MARYSGTWTTVTCTATANSPTDLADSTYCASLQGAGATVLVKINEVYIGGESAASVPTTMILARDAQIATGSLTGNTNALADVQSTAPGTIASFFNAAATLKPRRSATLHLLHLSLNTYGGIARWQARYGEELTVYGQTANIGQVSLSSITGNGISSGHMLYEVV